MAVKLLPPVIEGKIPAQTGNSLKIPFQHSRGVGPGFYSHFVLKIKTSSTGQQLGLIKSENENQKDSIVIFNLQETNIDLTPGQYYKVQLAYVNNENEVGYFSTIGIFKYTTYPKIYIIADEEELTRQGASANSNLYTGVYQQESYTIFDAEALKNGIETIKKLREERVISIKKYLGLSETVSTEDKIEELEKEKKDKESILKLYEICIEDLGNIIKETEEILEESEDQEVYLEMLNGKELFNITEYGSNKINFKDEALSILETYDESEKTEEDANKFTSDFNNLLLNFEIISIKEIEAELELWFNSALEEVKNNDPLKLAIQHYYSTIIPKMLNNNTVKEYRDNLKNIFISYEQNKNISNSKTDLEAIPDIAYDKGYYSLLEYFKEELKILEDDFILFLSKVNYINSIIEELNTIKNLPSLDDINITEDTTDKEYEEKFQTYLYSPGERQYLNKKILFNTIGDNSEKVYSYRFDVYKGDELFETSGELIHNASKDTEANISYDSYTLTKDLEEYVHYSIQYVVTTGNNLVACSPRYLITKTAEKKIDLQIEIIIPDIESSDNKEVEQALLNKEEGYFTVGLKFNQTTSIQGQYRILRADSLSNYNIWTEMAKFKIDDYIQAGSYYWMFDDFTVQHGVSYIYAIQQFGGKIYSEKQLSKKVSCNFVDTFLYDGARQLKIQFNPKVSSFKNTLLESKLDTIGGTHPFVFRNARTKYKEFPISGLISYLMDNNQMFLTNEELKLESGEDRESTTELKEQNKPTRSTNLTSENILSERIFKLEVLNWLTNGQPKLFRSPTEGNYIVRLLNVSLSPNDTLGRMLHTFTATGYEIAANTPDNLRYYNFIKNFNFEEKIRTTYHYNYSFVNKAKGTKINFEPSIFARFTNMAPWTEFKLFYDSGEEAIIQIGLTGQYNVEQTGLISVEVMSENVKEGNLEIHVQNQNFDQIIENLEIVNDNNSAIKQNFILQEIRSKDYYIQVTSDLALKEFAQEPSAAVDDSKFHKKVLFGSEFFKDRFDEITGELVRSSLNNIIFLRIESKPINITNEQDNRLRTSLYIEPEAYDSLIETNSKEQIKQAWREYFYYTLEELNSKEPPAKSILDYGIIEGKPYGIPTRIPTGYIEFTAEDFDKPMMVALGPGVYADVCYRVIEQVYKPIDIGIKEEVINVL